MKELTERQSSRIRTYACIWMGWLAVVPLVLVFISYTGIIKEPASAPSSFITVDERSETAILHQREGDSSRPRGAETTTTSHSKTYAETEVPGLYANIIDSEQDAYSAEVSTPGDEQSLREALRAVSLAVFGIIDAALISAIWSVSSRFPRLSPNKQLKRLQRIRTLAGAQALIGAALIATLLQFGQDWIAEQLLVGTLVWTASSLWYFIAHRYELKIEG